MNTALKTERVSDTSPAEMPRERCLSQGARTLSLRECLALILNSGPPGRGALGLARSILDRPGSGLPESESMRAFFLALEVSPLAHLQGISGLGEAGQARVLAAFEIGRRYALYRIESETRRSNHPKPSQLARQALLRITPSWRNEAQEWLGFVPCYRGQRVGELCIVERGVRTHVNIETVELFARILALRPQGFYLFHNHPSGDLTPSSPDREITEHVERLGAQLGPRLLGHGIVTAHGETWLDTCVRVRYDRDS